MEEGGKKSQTALGNKQWAECGWGQSSSSLHLAGAAVCRGLFVSMWHCTDLSHLLLPQYLQTFISQCAQLFLLFSPETCLVSALPSPAPGFFSVSLNHFTFHASLVTCGVLQVHPEQFIDILFCLLTCSCFEEISKFLFPDGLLVRLFGITTQEKDPSPSPHLFCGVCLSFTTLLVNGVLKAWAAHRESSRLSPCLMHH